MQIQFDGTFDTTSALSGMYLWILFGYLSVLLNCDLQRLVQSHPLVMHFIGIIAFFFLFTVLDSSNKVDITTVWLKTFVVYTMFVLITKSKWYFVVPVLALLLIDQTLKKDLAFDANRGINEDKLKKKEDRVKILNQYIQYIVYGLIAVGTLHYAYLQRIEYGKQFSWWKFFIGVSRNCKKTMPVYKLQK